MKGFALFACFVLVGNVVSQSPSRSVHPGIADPAPGLQLRSAPLFAVPDGVWNHGEGFAPSGTPDADYGGWFNNEDGTGLGIADVHTPQTSSWVNFDWSSPFYNGGALFTMRRLEGYLRPVGVPGLPTVHPLYGDVSSLLPNGYVDQGAFEMFCPVQLPTTNQKIVICVVTWQTRVFPLDHNDKRLSWRNTYMGIFSPDGLERREQVGIPRDAQHFAANNDDSMHPTTGVQRPNQVQIIASWSPSADYWPILVYEVPTVMHRPPTLHEQRFMQIAQATKLLLQESSARNPIWPQTALTSSQVDARCVVCLAGGSAGGISSQFAALRFPNLVHGSFAEVMTPSVQRLVGEWDMVNAMARFGAEATDAGLSTDDFLEWNQYAWSEGVEVNDLSYLRRYVQGVTHRPAIFGVGDEDITSTGTDWVRVLDGSQWADHGVSAPPLTQGYVTHYIGWMVAENGCHQRSVAPVVPPTGGTATFSSIEIAHDLFTKACAQRDVELGPPVVPPPPEYPVSHVPRTVGQSLRGLDDPHEWFYGRLGSAMPAAPIANTTFKRDDTFFAPMQVGATEQQGATGATPGGKEAMIIYGGHVYVGSIDGVVTSFVVDQNDPKMPLVAVARSAQLGHDVSALAVLGGGSNAKLVVGSRRHLHLLNLNTLATLAEVELPWELARPHHMRVADVLPGHPGEEIVFASVHGGLVFYDQNLQFVHEWTEPGIVDFAISGGVVTILSSRCMLANVTFSGPMHTPTLVAASEAYPSDFAMPTQGTPVDMELMWADWGAFGQPLAVMSIWNGDSDGNDPDPNGVTTSGAIRSHWQGNLQRIGFQDNSAPWIDLAVCSESATYYNASGSDIGDHLIALASDGTVRLFDQFGTLLGEKNLTTTAQGYWPFGAGAHTMAVGDLVNANTDYADEIVFATNQGLMWMHVDDLLWANWTALPATGTPSGAYASGYWMEVASAGFSGTGVQPRTNQTLSAAWAMARLPDPSFPSGFDDKLHVLDMRGNYWRIDHSGHMELWDRFPVGGTQGWGYCGPVTGKGAGFNLQPLDTYLFRYPVLGSPLWNLLTRPWWGKSEFAGDLVYQRASPPVILPNAWARGFSLRTEIGGLMPFDHGGSVLDLAGGAHEVWMWAAGNDWADLLEGLQIDGAGVVQATWSSVQEPTSVDPTNSIGTGCDYTWLRSFISGIPAMQQESIQAVQLTSGPRVLVLGCPGGRVRIVQPGSWRTGDTVPQGAGTVLASSPDLGFGGSALAVREVAGGSLQIFFGTIEHPASRPSGYDDPLSSLVAGEEVHGAIHLLTWSPGMVDVRLEQTIELAPSNGRGAYGVTGMKLADLGGAAGDELVVTTLSGDLLIYQVGPTGTLTEWGKTYVPGAIGLHNSIAVEDLNGDGHPEIYVAGSLGLWRFVDAENETGLNQ